MTKRRFYAACTLTLTMLLTGMGHSELNVDGKRTEKPANFAKVEATDKVLVSKKENSTVVVNADQKYDFNGDKVVNVVDLAIAKAKKDKMAVDVINNFLHGKTTGVSYIDLDNIVQSEENTKALEAILGRDDNDVYNLESYDSETGKMRLNVCSEGKPYTVLYTKKNYDYYTALFTMEEDLVMKKTQLYKDGVPYICGLLKNTNATYSLLLMDYSEYTTVIEESSLGESFVANEKSFEDFLSASSVFCDGNNIVFWNMDTGQLLKTEYDPIILYADDGTWYYWERHMYAQYEVYVDGKVKNIGIAGLESGDGNEYVLIEIVK